MGPGGAGVRGAIDAVAPPRAVAVVRLTRAQPDDLRIRRRDGHGARGRHRFPVEYAVEAGPLVGGLHEAAGGEGDVIRAGVDGVEGDVRDPPAHHGRPDFAGFEGLQRRRRDQRRAGGWGRRVRDGGSARRPGGRRRVTITARPEDRIMRRSVSSSCYNPGFPRSGRPSSSAGATEPTWMKDLLDILQAMAESKGRTDNPLELFLDMCGAGGEVRGAAPSGPRRTRWRILFLTSDGKHLRFAAPRKFADLGHHPRHQARLHRGEHLRPQGRARP